MVKRVGFSYAIIKLPDLSVFSPYPYIDLMLCVLRLITDLSDVLKLSELRVCFSDSCCDRDLKQVVTLFRFLAILHRDANAQYLWDLRLKIRFSSLECPKSHFHRILSAI